VEILESEIPKLITPEAQTEMVDWLANVPNAQGWSAIIKNPLAYYSDLASIIIADRVNDHSKDSGQPLPSSLLKIQAQWECVYEIRDFLQDFHGFTRGPHLPWREIDEMDQWHLQEVSRETDSTRWVLNERRQAGCYWCPQKAQRVLGVFSSYALINDHGAMCEFSPAEERKSWITLMEFCVPPNEQGHWFRNLGWLKECWEILAVNRRCLGLKSPCLISPFNASPVRKEFRFDPVALEGEPDAWKLLKLWMMAGAARPKHTGDLKDNLYFAAPAEAKKLKAECIKMKRGNPYRHLRHSIYGPELEKELKA
jgi:hypothetical protein